MIAKQASELLRTQASFDEEQAREVMQALGVAGLPAPDVDLGGLPGYSRGKLSAFAESADRIRSDRPFPDDDTGDDDDEEDDEPPTLDKARAEFIAATAAVSVAAMHLMRAEIALG